MSRFQPMTQLDEREQALQNPEKLVSEYLAYLQKPDEGRPYSPNTIKVYGETLSHFLRFYQENELSSLNEVNEFAIRHFLRELRNASNLSEGTIKLHKAALSAFFSWLHYMDYWDDPNPVVMFSRKSRSRTTKRRLPTVLDEKELEAVMLPLIEKGEHIQAMKAAALIGLLVDTGLRISEALNLKIKDGKRLLEGRVVIVRGKGDKERSLHYLGDWSDELSTHIYVLQSRGMGDDDWLFPGKTPGSPPLTPSGAYRIVRKALERAGIGKPRMGPHVLRHTAASLMIKRGLDLNKVKNAMGHSSISVTEIYLHVI